MSDETRAESHDSEWEMVEGTGSSIRQFRQWVPGGWLVLCAIDETSSAVFLPDPDHLWRPPIKKSRKRSDFF